MNPATLHSSVAGPAGALQCALDRPGAGSPDTGVLALICHPHPLHGGTMDNKVVQTVARALLQLGCTTLRFNFRGVGTSQGSWGEGLGEIDDAAAVLAAHRKPGQPLILGGFSFGGYVASQLAARLVADVAAEGAAEGAADGAASAAHRLVLVAPAVASFVAAPVPADTVLIHGEQDDVVPLQAVLDWARPQQLPVTVLPGAGHFFHGQLPALKQIVLRAFSAQLVPT